MMFGKGEARDAMRYGSHDEQLEAAALDAADAREAAEVWNAPVPAGYNTTITVLARNGMMYDVPVCATDSAEVIGRNVILAMGGAGQRSTLKCDACRNYSDHAK